MAAHGDFLTNQGLGFAAQYLGSGDIASSNAVGASLGSYSAHFAAYSLSYGRRLGNGPAVGINAKWLDAKISDISAHSWAIDIGTMWRASSRLSLGAVAQNIGPGLRFISERADLPTRFRVGAGYQASSSLMVTLDGTYEKQKIFSASTGVEWSPLSIFALRAGYRTETLRKLNALAGLSVGCGLSLWDQEIGLAWVPYGDLGSTEYISFTLRFGKNTQGSQSRMESSFKPVAQLSSNTDPSIENLMSLNDERLEKRPQ